DGTGSNGVANATADLTPLPAADVIGEPKWTSAKEKSHEHGQKGEVSIKSKVKKPHDVKIVLEQQRGGPIWEKIDEKLVKVSNGEAKATFDLEHPHAKEAARDHSELLKAPTWEQKPGAKGQPGRLVVAAPALEDGRKVKLIVERLGRDKKWSAVKTVEA